MKDILTTAGSFRGVNIGIGFSDGVTHVAPPHGVVPDLMHDLFSWLKNSDEHMLIKSCIFHYEFEFIHPFSDGKIEENLANLKELNVIARVGETSGYWEIINE